MLEPYQAAQLLNGLIYAHAIASVGSPRFPQLVPVRGQILPLDSDADGVPDFLDHCPGTPTESLINAHGCTLEQLAPCDAPWKNHGEYVNALKRALDEFVQEGLLDRAQARALFESGAQSDCGKRKAVIAPPQRRFSRVRF